MTEKTLKIAFAGLRHGHILSLIDLLNSRKDIEVLGAYDGSEEGRADGEKRGISRWYASMEELLADPEVDAVAVGDCFADRGALAIQALRAGKHVVADKPLCTDLTELEIIRREALERGLAVGIMLDMRDNPNIVAAEKAVKSGIIGKVNNILFEGQHPLMYGSRPGWYFEEGKHGGVINDIAIHGIDYCRHMTGAGLEKVIGARCWNFYADKEPAFKDSAQFMLQLEGGIGVLGDVSYGSPDSQGYSHPAYWHTRVVGSQGYLTFSYNGEGVQVCLQGEKEPRMLPPVPAESTWLDRFAEAVNGGKSTPAPVGENNIALTEKKKTALVGENSAALVGENSAALVGENSAALLMRRAYTIDMLRSQEEALLVQKAADE